MNLDWLDLAACRRLDRDPDLWHPSGPHQQAMTRVAQHICSSCPVQAECFLYCMNTEGENRFGVWGGVGPGYRAAVAAARRRVLVNP